MLGQDMSLQPLETPLESAAKYATHSASRNCLARMVEKLVDARTSQPAGFTE